MKTMRLLVTAVGVWGITIAGALAYLDYMTGDDALGSSSFNAAGRWYSGFPPAAGNDYETRGYLLRTPTTAGTYTFAGDSLRVGIGTMSPPDSNHDFRTNGTVNNNSLLNKTPNATIIINNLILDAGYVRDGMGSADIWRLQGNITITANGGGFACQERFEVDAAIRGSGPLYIADNGSGEAARTIYINSPQNTFTGNIILLGTTAARCRLTFSPGSVMNFKIWDSGINNRIYADTFQNKYGTLTLNGTFKFDLADAGRDFGDSWTIISYPNLTVNVGDTFAVDGFTRAGGGTGPGLWYTDYAGTPYYFDTSTGVLWVPEPGAYALVLAGLGLLAIRRWKA